ncbi:hypothetical protein R1flu_027181 [Riccia fluitans]|uniref:Uncharacterized protein n=1 Tax=Riccia fluitans TaxID=41844 RepID=A0ABD1XM50_9MARC
MGGKAKGANGETVPRENSSVHGMSAQLSVHHFDANHEGDGSLRKNHEPGVQLSWAGSPRCPLMTVRGAALKSSIKGRERSPCRGSGLTGRARRERTGQITQSHQLVGGGSLPVGSFTLHPLRTVLAQAFVRLCKETFLLPVRRLPEGNSVRGGSRVEKHPGGLSLPARGRPRGQS